MRQSRSRQARRGAIVPLVAVSLIAILGMVALAIDIGMVAVAKTQAQNAADSAAMAGTRSLNQQTGYNLSGSTKAAVTAATQNKIFDTNITGDPSNITNPSADTYVSGQVKIECGGYYYVYNDSTPSAEKFGIVVPGKSATEPYTALRATITSTSPVFFGSVFGASAFNVVAHATAAHRPRDVVIIMDLSGSMRFQSCPGGYYDGTNLTPQNGPRNKSLNPDTNYPTFGHYSDTTAAALYGNTTYTTGAELVDPANLVVTSNSGPACVLDIMSSGSTTAFSAAPSSQATTPAGDNYIKAGSVYAKTATDIVGANPSITSQVDWCRNGYSSSYNANATFNGYTEGPGYWGKTFFIWPPDPRGSDLDATVAANHADNGAKDWRQRFFFKKNTSTNTLYWLDNNNILFNPSGTPCTTDGGTTNYIKKAPNTTTTITEDGQSVTYRYCINYAAIFHWLRNTAPTHFPASMTTGRIKYYTSIPNPTGDSNFNTRFWTQNPMSDLSERFWKDYVDFMLGFVQNGANSYSNSDGSNPWTAYIGNGDYYAWGTMQVKQKPDSNITATVNNSGGYAKGYSGTLTFNNVKKLDGTNYDLPGPQPVTGATATTPVKISSTAHGLTNGNIINIQGVGGTIGTVVNSSVTKPSWTVTVIDVNTFSLNGSVGVGTYTANTGSWVPAITAATNANPIVITTGAPHLLPTSLPTSTSASATPTITVNLTGVTGNAAANGKWTVTVINSTQFSLTNSTGNGTFTNLLGTQWWEPVFYVRFGTQTTFYELNPALTTSGILTATPDIVLAADVANSTSVKIYTTVPKYMDYADNPYRPRHHMWFGPQSWLDWLGNYSIGNYPNGTNALRWPGNVHEAQAWACKVGISAAIDDIKNNHPNDFVGMAFFSSPNYSTSGGGQFNTPVVPLGRNYQNLKDSLWFPPSTVAGAVTTITPYDPDMANVPRAHGGTAPGMGFMLSYNLLSSSASNLRSYATPTTTYRGYDGGLGRKGAARLVIFETDGAPNTRAFATLNSAGADSYYPVRFKAPADVSNASNEFPSGGGYTGSEVTDVVKQLVALDTASPPGYSTTRKTAQVFSLGYGTLFDPNNKSNTTAQNNALTFLQTVQYYGNVNTAGGTSGTNFPDWQRIYGDTTTRQTRLQSAFTKIMQSGVQVSLIE